MSQVIRKEFNFTSTNYEDQMRALLQEEKEHDFDWYRDNQIKMNNETMDRIIQRDNDLTKYFKDYPIYIGPSLTITKKFEFEAGHYLPYHNAKCQALHGHSYKLEVTIYNTINAHGFVMDFSVLKKIVKEKIIDVLDHNFLNLFLYLPTCENTLIWMWDKISEELNKYSKENYEQKLQLEKLKLYEQSDSFATLERVDLDIYNFNKSTYSGKNTNQK